MMMVALENLLVPSFCKPLGFSVLALLTPAIRNSTQLLFCRSRTAALVLFRHAGEGLCHLSLGKRCPSAATPKGLCRVCGENLGAWVPLTDCRYQLHHETTLPVCASSSPVMEKTLSPCLITKTCPEQPAETLPDTRQPTHPHSSSC